MAKRRTHPDWLDDEGNPVTTGTDLTDIGEESQYAGGVKKEYNFPEEDEEEMVTDGGTLTREEHLDKETVDQGRKGPHYWARKFGFETADELETCLADYEEKVPVKEFAEDHGIDPTRSENLGRAMAIIDNFQSYGIKTSLSAGCERYAESR